MPTILIIDDEDLIRRMLGRMLRRKGFDTTLAASASEAREFLAERAFDLVLSDVNMPGESGLDLVRYVMETYPDTAAVMVTGVDDPQVAATALKIGAYGYIRVRGWRRANRRDSYTPLGFCVGRSWRPPVCLVQEGGRKCPLTTAPSMPLRGWDAPLRYALN